MFLLCFFAGGEESKVVDDVVIIDMYKNGSEVNISWWLIVVILECFPSVCYWPHDIT